MDDFFDIMGASLFASGGKWCTLKNMPCFPLPSCDEYLTDDKCVYENVECCKNKDNKNAWNK